MRALLKGTILFLFMLMQLSGYGQAMIPNNTPVSFSQLMEGKAEEIIYKTVGGKSVRLYSFRPEGMREGDRRTAVVIIHGGGWTGGETEAFFPHARYFASRGAVAFSVEYRLAKAGETTVGDCISDCKSAMRYIRSHATELGINPDRIMVMGDSAGGHLAGCMGTVTGFDDPNDDLTCSDAPNMAILCNPLTDFTQSSFIRLVAGENELERTALAKRLSPLHHVRKNEISTLLVHGTADKVIAPSQSEALCEAMKQVGNDCELVLLPGANHAFVCVRWRAPEADVVNTIRLIDNYMCCYGFLKGESNLIPSVPEAWKPKQ